MEALPAVEAEALADLAPVAVVARALGCAAAPPAATAMVGTEAGRVEASEAAVALVLEARARAAAEARARATATVAVAAAMVVVSRGRCQRRCRTAGLAQ